MQPRKLEDTKKKKGDDQTTRFTERLWRLRKDHRLIEASVLVRTDAKGVTLKIHYNGEATDSRQWPTYELAAKAADARLRDFLRQGWATHW